MLEHELEYRAEQAKQLLSNPLFVEARQTVEGELKELICSLPLAEREKREQAVAILKGSEQFFRIFTLILNDYNLQRAEYVQAEQLQAREASILERLNHG